jgi:hypothetical protein
VRGPSIMLAVAFLLAGTPRPALSRADDGLTESPDGPEHVKVYLTPEQALAKVFPKADRIWAEEWQPTAEQVAALERGLGWKAPAGPVTFHRGAQGDKDLGWAVITEEQGRFKPITFIVHVQPDGRVGQVHVMVYRESRGDGVKRGRFLKQFRGKEADDPLRLNRDVVGVSGATLSSRAVAAGVKRVLAQVQLHYGEGEGP